jgi:hypothetical protein
MFRQATRRKKWHERRNYAQSIFVFGGLKLIPLTRFRQRSHNILKALRKALEFFLILFHLNTQMRRVKLEVGQLRTFSATPTRNAIPPIISPGLKNIVVLFTHSVVHSPFCVHIS